MSHNQSRQYLHLITVAFAIAISLTVVTILAGFSDLASFWIVAVVDGVQEYLVWTVIFFALFWVALNRWLRRRKLARRRWPTRTQLTREVMFSVCSQFVFVAVGVCLAFSESWGMDNMYLQLGPWDVIYVPFVTLVVLILDDTYFYWTHRLMHHPMLFERVHRVHHESVDPTPFTAFSFHPLEAIVLGIGGLSILPAVLLLPWHPIAVIAAGTFSTLFNVIGHLGYEIYPRGWTRFPILRWKTPGYHHYMHHQRVQGNYGLYFRWWDRLCGTEFKDFESRYDRLFQKPEDSVVQPASIGT